jgi:hypothetical protein
MFAGKGGALRDSTIVRLGWKQLTVTNTLAYYDSELTGTVKGFIVQAHLLN